MIDIHCHILWGLDDGAADMAEALEMARIAYADGVRCIVATPHFTNDWLNVRDVVERKVRELQRALDEAGIAVTVRAGNEVRLESEDFVTRHAEREQFGYLDEGKRFVLLEQRWVEYEPASSKLVKWFKGRGTTPIIAHPERHAFSATIRRCLRRLPTSAPGRKYRSTACWAKTGKRRERSL
ncbi:CpsB/CapC family capsule biosynthesis tyrosine phosphatase [Gordoniibacillus kamchatkensis]|uniref:CpsB/CapC family capsule biosynthesis tyrosine phosphatase n=1 Tax=Gordoniibacillus kamchatkensis TaxID=1590651 RepID=UPI000698F4B8|nr:CpsB/CapC family capsule biosynthesis tyrosine phosphatase [Paenibacillus sp. VKM B-2647]